MADLLYSGIISRNLGATTLAVRLCPAILAALLAGGCASRVSPPAELPAPAAECATLFRDVDSVIARSDARDHGPTGVTGFPWLRTNRFLASFTPDLDHTEPFEAWLGRLAQLDSAARRLELRNYGAGIAGMETEALESELNRCRTLLQEDLLQDPELRAQLKAAVKVPDDYVAAWRVLGLYPFAAPFVSLGISRWHEKTRKIFDTPLDQLPVAGRLRRWRVPYPEAGNEYTPRYDSLGVPVLDEAAMKALFRRHAPVWEVDVTDHNDRIGTPEIANKAAVSTGRATQYHYHSYTRFGGQILLQLNYVIWFPSRPGTDIYAGNIDGLTWRVTLGPGGQPWLYDSIHNCGCYHMYFPTAHLQLREDLPVIGFETPLVPQRAPQPPIVVRIDSGRHYIQRVYEDTHGDEAGAVAGELVEADYDQLRSLPTAGRHRSLFGPFGLVPGSERGERFLLWPMGVRSPGAMRQRGHQPVAFVGRRHFDDARLIENLFEKRVQ